ncbi:UDP-Glycosyltransferase/glycogen phosphorylase [Lophium mytilinum]|uniref:UDP-Glycosyltransferase/glycogen phosphorylase n=1 Tax=Lophium mytilinum TaxID=390894 RepID=A0A6A6QXE3_9PEZI|nr:UDP-Glycosyltransferase/glycogen phosphorylase [Lophium mytilinum]
MPAWGHLEKVSVIAADLKKRGYPITFITGAEFRDPITALGVGFVPLDGSDRMMSEEDMATFFAMPAGLDAEAFAIKNVFIRAIPDHYRTVQRVFGEFRKKHGRGKPLIFVYDGSFLGLTPVALGADGIKPDVSIGIGLAPLSLRSDDTFPFRSGKQPDTSRDAVKIHQKAYEEQAEEPFFKGIHEALVKEMRGLGVEREVPFSIFELMNWTPDQLLQLSIPEFEYPRSDIRAGVEWVGALPVVGMADAKLPSWWDDVLQAKGNGKKVIAVTSGSIDNNPEDLILPTLEALKDRIDVLVIATLVASDGDGLEERVPVNARMAKFIPYDMLLPYVDVLVSNGGYGTVQQALRAGVPMVLSGVGQDKAQTGGVAAWAGVAIDLQSRSPGVEKLRKAIHELLENKKYASRASELAANYDNYDTLKAFDNAIQDAVKRLR